MRAENNLLRIKGTNSCEIYPWPAHVGFSIGTSTYLAVVKKERNYSIPGSGYTRTVRHVVPSWRRPLEIIDEPQPDAKFHRFKGPSTVATRGKDRREGPKVRTLPRPLRAFDFDWFLLEESSVRTILAHGQIQPLRY